MSLMITPTNPATISIAAGQSLVVKDMSGVSSLSPGTLAREDASVRIGAGFFVYGPASADGSFTLSTTGLSFYDIKQGDPTPANAQLLYDPGNPPTSTPSITGDGAAAIGSTVGGRVNGATAQTFPGGFFSQSFVRRDQTLQAAVDAAPASATLVSTVTAGIVDLGNGVYGVPLPAQPSALFYDAISSQYAPAAFSGNTIPDPDGQLTGNALIWTWDAANSRAICYNAGVAVTTVTTVKYHAVVAIDRATYDSVVLRPGIVVVGLGQGITEIRNLTGRTQVVNISNSTRNMGFSLVTASYSGIVGCDIVRNMRTVTEGGGYCGIVVPTETSSDAFTALDCHIYMEPGVIAFGSYTVGIWFGSLAGRSSRAKNMQFVNCLIETFSGRDIFETYSGSFNGLVIFRGCQINGSVYIDGATNTFILIDTPYTNLNSPNRDRAQQTYGGFNFALNMGSLGPFPGYTHAYIAINSPHRIVRVEDVAVPSGGMYAMGIASSLNITALMSFRNSPITADKLAFRIGGGLAQSSLNTISAKGSAMPPGEVGATTGSSLSATTATPLIPRTFTQQTVGNTTTTPKVLGYLSILLEDLQERGEARALVRGKFAANTNLKTLQVQMGANAALASMSLTNISGASASGAFNGTVFEYTVTVRVTGSTALISGTLDVNGTVTRFSAEQALTAAQYLQVGLQVTGVATNDITTNYQQLEVAG